MTVDEASRHDMFLKLEAVVGRQAATTLMEHLPPVGWADVATKRDLDQLAVATKRDLDQLAVATRRDLDQLAVATRRDLDHVAESLENRLLAQFRSELVAQTRTFVLSMFGAVLTSTGIAVSVALAL
jgi:hypothetical protein